jgi:hypothetical protein
MRNIVLPVRYRFFRRTIRIQKYPVRATPERFQRIGFLEKKVLFCSLVLGGHGAVCRSRHDTKNWIFGEMFMTPTFRESLAKLERLSPEKLDQTSRRIRSALGSAEWQMGLCLLALKRNGAFRRLGYGTLTDYAERVLNLSGRKTGMLIGAAEALEHLPLVSEAFRLGKICWTKVRAIHGLATPETERQWLDFAASHRAREVENRVALSPREWKRHRALNASLEGRPIVGTEDVAEILAAKGSPENGDAERVLDGEKLKAPGSRREKLEVDFVTPMASAQEGGARASLPEPPSPPKTIRLVFELTPDQYALYEQAESRVRAQQGKRIPRAEVLEQMADTVLSQGTARARARHQVLVHTTDGGDQAWYDTERGILPVGPEVLEEALATAEVLRADSLGVKPARGSADLKTVDGLPGAQGGSDAKTSCRLRVSEEADAGEPSTVQEKPLGGLETVEDLGFLTLEAREEEPDTRTPRKTRRTAVPNAILRQVFARARHRCERCGSKGGRLDVHHRTPVSEGGGNVLSELELLCSACHTLSHEEDLAQKPYWRAAKRAAMRVSGSREQ